MQFYKSLAQKRSSCNTEKQITPHILFDVNDGLSYTIGGSIKMQNRLHEGEKSKYNIPV